MEDLGAHHHEAEAADDGHDQAGAQATIDTSDFVLHTTAVGACENRSRLAELLHKTLEKRYALTIRRFAASKTADGVRQLWREATASGVELPGALWAAWTHPCCVASQRDSRRARAR